MKNLKHILTFLCLLGLFLHLSAQDANKEAITCEDKTHTHHHHEDMTGYVDFVSSKVNPEYFSHDDHESWKYYLNKPHPKLDEVEKYFDEAAEEFGVPAELLKVIGQIESNWTQMGPSIDRGWGIMHLVENHYANTLSEAAALIKVSSQTLKDDARQNIRGAAALMGQYYKETDREKGKWQRWFDASKKFSGLINDDLKTKQAIRYFNILKDGITSTTIWEETIKINKKSDLEVPGWNVTKSVSSADYSPAISNIISTCSGSDNFGSGRNHSIDTWVNHWIGVGTYAGAISWFHTCPCDRNYTSGYCAANPCNCPSSAHFVIANNGEITQTVGVDNTAYHAGADGQPNNGRSIGVEHEATAANPGLWNSEQMLDASTEMACYFIDQYNIPSQRGLPGIREHNEMPGTSTNCAGNIPWTTWMNKLNLCLNNSCTDSKEPNDDFNNGSLITPSSSLTTINDLCLKNPDVDVFSFTYNNTDFAIAVNLKSGDTEERYYNLTYKLSSQGDLEVETTFHSGTSPPDTELYLVTELGGIYYPISYDDDSGSNPPLSKLTANINDPIITPPESLAFTCDSGCGNDLHLNCGALSAETAGNTITISNLQISNQGSSAASNVVIEYTLVGASSHVIGTQTVAGPIAAGAYITAAAPYLWLTGVPNGSYQLQAKLSNGSGPDHTCISTGQIDVGVVSGDGVDLEFISCGSISANSSGYFMPYNLQNTDWGTAPATQLGVYLSTDATLDASDSFIKDSYVPSMVGYGSVSAGVQFQIDNSSLPEGDVYIILKADKDDEVSETNEDNNECAYQLNSCDSDNVTTNGNITNDVEATNYIIAPGAGNQVTIAPTANVNFKAGKYIDLMPGFTAEYGSTFLAYIESCGIPPVGSSALVVSPTDGTEDVIQQETALTLRNYPNPFTGQTTIEFVLPQDSPVTLFVSDMTGRKVALLLDNEAKTKGTHLSIFDGSNYPAGMYYYTIQAGEFVSTQKMILVK